MRQRILRMVGLVGFWPVLSCSLLAGAALAEDAVKFENLGLPAPTVGTRDYVPDGFKGCPPGSVCAIQRPAIHPERFYMPDLIQGRTIATIRVADDEVGIFNASDQQLAFSIEAPPGKVTLKSKQIKTIGLAGARAVKASIQTGSTPSQSTLDSGNVYVIEASGGNWVFKKF